MALAVSGLIVLTDEELVGLIKAGDIEAFDVLVRRYFERTRKVVRRLVGENDVDDVTQNIFVSLVKSIGSFRSQSAFAPWFSKIVYRRVADHYRRMFRRKNGEDGMPVPHTLARFPAPGADLEFQEFIEQLPLICREVIWKKFVDGMTDAEVASALGLTCQAVRSRRRRGIEAAAEVVRKEWC